MHSKVGSCPHCGAPIYAPTTWMGITPPPSMHSCHCAAQPKIKTTTGFGWEEKELNSVVKPEKGEISRYKLFGDYYERIEMGQ